MIDLHAHAGVTVLRPPSPEAPLPGEPSDLRALYAVTDGLELTDGTRILGRGEIAGATAWLTSERALEWGPDLWVIGERAELVIVRDLDAAGIRAGGGVLEAPTDGLSAPERAAIDLIGYLEERLAATSPRAPERAARAAAARGDAERLAQAIARTFYPGAERELWHAALALGALRAAAGDAEGAMDAFTRAVDARVLAAPRGAGASEARAAWRACAATAEKAGATELAERCRQRARS